jgi:hypothetical protein
MEGFPKEKDNCCLQRPVEYWSKMICSNNKHSFSVSYRGLEVEVEDSQSRGPNSHCKVWNKRNKESINELWHFSLCSTLLIPQIDG